MRTTIEHLKKNLIKIISETNGLSLNHTLELLLANRDTTEEEKKSNTRVPRPHSSIPRGSNKNQQASVSPNL